MAEGFQVARLIPVSGIGNATEAEMRATSGLLAVLTIVRDLSRSMFSPLGASSARKATVEAFIETRFKLSDGTLVRPDGLVQVTYGASSWKALVEVKTGDNALQAEQVNAYLVLAREQGFDAVVTISNEIAVGSEHPCEGVRTRANARVRLAHYSWTEVLGKAVHAKVHRGVSDPEQSWILGELIRYLKHPASGALAFEDMGNHWTSVREGARAGALHRSDPAVRDIVQRWEQLARYAALRLGSSTGADVQPVVPRSQSDVRTRLAHAADVLVGSGVLEATLRIPGSAGNLGITADLRARQLTASTTIAAPADRGSRARIGWLLRQLDDGADDLVVESWPRLARQPVCAALTQVRGDRDVLLDPSGREILRFRLVARCEMGQSRRDGGRSAGFIRSVTGLVDRFYEEVLQKVEPWVQKAPQARPAPGPVELVVKPITDRDDLDDAVVAARVGAGEESSDEGGAATQRE